MIKVGDTFEVVRILSDAGYINIFDVGKDTVGVPTVTTLGMNCIPNHKKADYHDKIRRWYLLNRRLKPVGRLTITKVK